MHNITIRYIVLARCPHTPVSLAVMFFFNTVKNYESSDQ